MLKKKLTAAQRAVLRGIGRGGTATAIAKRIESDPGPTTSVCNWLRKRQLLSAQKGADGRLRYKITDRGKAALKTA